MWLWVRVARCGRTWFAATCRPVRRSVSRDRPPVPPSIRTARDPEGLSFNSFPRAHRNALWAALAISCALLLAALATSCHADEDGTHNQNTGESASCDKYAAVDGSDDAGGTRADPFRTVQRLVDSLSAGQVGCLRGGVYTQPDKQVIFEKGGDQGGRIVLRSYPGETAQFRGLIYIPRGSDYITIYDLRLDGSYGAVGRGHSRGDRNTAQAVKVMGDDVNILDNNITNRRPNGNPDLAGTCIILGSSEVTAVNVSIKGNRIHRCGQLPRTNHEHGIYASNIRGAKIVDNLIYDNADRGIQLYPNAKRTLVEGNVIDDNGQGLVINGNSSYNTVRNNVFSNPADSWNINLGPKLSGTGNRVVDNCVWAAGGESRFNHPGFFTNVLGNVTANPRYRNLHSFQVTNPTCLGKYRGTLMK